MEEMLIDNQGTGRAQTAQALSQTAARVGVAVSVWVGFRLLFLLIDMMVINRLKTAGVSDNILQVTDLALSAVGVYLIATPIALWVLGMFKDGRFQALFAKSRMPGRELAAAIPMGYTITIGVNLVATVILLVASGSLEQVVSQNPILNMPKGTLGVTLNYLWAVLIAPIFEEVFFRGALISTLKRYGNWFAVLVSAALFGLAHGNIAQMLYAFVLGLVLGMVFIKSGSVLPGILMHFAINFLGITISTFFSPETMGVVAILGLLVVAVLITGVILIIITLVNFREKLRLGNGCTSLSRGEKVQGLLKSPFIILMLLLTLIFLAVATVPGLAEQLAQLLK